MRSNIIQTAYSFLIYLVHYTNSNNLVKIIKNFYMRMRSGSKVDFDKKFTFVTV